MQYQYLYEYWGINGVLAESDIMYISNAYKDSNSERNPLSFNPFFVIGAPKLLFSFLEWSLFENAFEMNAWHNVWHDKHVVNKNFSFLNWRKILKNSIAQTCSPQLVTNPNLIIMAVR